MKLKDKNGNVYFLHIKFDSNTDSPREWSNMGKMVLFHKRYNFSNELNLNTEDYKGWLEMEKALKQKFKAKVILPVYMLDHSGITISTIDFNDHWDSGQIGFIIATEEDIKEYMDIKRITKKTLEKVKKSLINEVDIYNHYVRGEVYEYILYKCVDCEEKFEDSYGGFYDLKSLLYEINNILEEKGIEKLKLEDITKEEIEWDY